MFRLNLLTMTRGAPMVFAENLRFSPEWIPSNGRSHPF